MPDSVLREPQAQPSQESKWGDARLVDSTSPAELKKTQWRKFFNSGLGRRQKLSFILLLIGFLSQMANLKAVDIIMQRTGMFWFSPMIYHICMFSQAHN